MKEMVEEGMCWGKGTGGGGGGGGRDAWTSLPGVGDWM